MNKRFHLWKHLSAKILCLMFLLVVFQPIRAEASYADERWQWTSSGEKQERCTYRAWHEAYDRLGISLPLNWGNAGTWAANARSQGYQVDYTPAPNSIVCWQGGSEGWGHVAYVTAVDSSAVYIREGGITPKNGMYYQDTSFSRSNPDRWKGFRLMGYIHLTASYSDDLTISAKVTDCDVDVSWSHIAGAASYYTYTLNLANNTVVFGENLGQAYTTHLLLSPGEYMSVVTANMSDGTQKSATTRYIVGKLVVQAQPLGNTVDVSWNDLGASSYYVYVQNRDTGDIPYGENIGKRWTIHLELSEGSFSVFVTAVFSSDNMKSGRADFTSEKLKANTQKGEHGVFLTGEQISLCVNAASFDRCVLEIYRTPSGGETYKYWEGLIDSTQYETSFSQEGYYSCHFLVTSGTTTLDSLWVGWNVRENTNGSLYLPNALKEIGSEAFAQLAVDVNLVIPEEIVSIAENAFDGSNVFLLVKKDSYGEWFARHYSLPYGYYDD